MISVNQARELLSKNFERSKTTKIPLGKSLGKILAENIFSPMDVPSFDNSAKDGYALKFDESRNTYFLANTIQAGDTSTFTVKSGQTARIFTGAKIPQETDTVIPQEWVQKNEKTGEIFFQKEKIKLGINIRKKGSQCKKGDLIVEKGTKITPGIIGLLASVGLSEIMVFSAPSVAIIITGNELKEIGFPLKEGEIYNCNGPMLEALLMKNGIEKISTYHAPDEKEKLQKTIDETLERNDFLLVSGGISVGDYDFVEECLVKAGVEKLFYKVKQRPGKPLFAGKKGTKWIFALPGNPGSVFSCFNQFVRPCLNYSLGCEKVWEPTTILPLAEDFKKAPLTFFVKAKREKNQVHILKGQQSFNLQSFNTADCLVELKEETELVKAGTLVKVYSF